MELVCLGLVEGMARLSKSIEGTIVYIILWGRAFRETIKALGGVVIFFFFFFFFLVDGYPLFPGPLLVRCCFVLSW